MLSTKTSYHSRQEEYTYKNGGESHSSIEEGNTRNNVLEKNEELGNLEWEDRGRTRKPRYPSESESTNTQSTEDSSLWYSPLSDETSENESDALVESCLRELEGRSFDTNNNSNERQRQEMNAMQISNQSSYSHHQETSSSHSNYHANHNGASHHSNTSQMHQQQSSSYQNGYEGRDAMKPHDARSNRSLREHEDGDLYEFGSVKYAGSLTSGSQKGSRGPSQSGSMKSSRSYRDNKLDEEYMNSFNDGSSRVSNMSRKSEPVHQYSSKGYSKKGTSSNSNGGVGRSMTLPRSNGHLSTDLDEEVDVARYHSSTLPRRREEPPRSSSPVAEPISEAIVEEERHNADGTTSLIRRIVTATTTRVFHENQIPKVEVHISPATETIISPLPPSMPPSIYLDTEEGPQLNSTATDHQHFEHVTTSASYRQDDKYTAEYIDTRNANNSGFEDRHISFRGSDRSYDASRSEQDYSGHDEYDRQQRSHNDRTTKTTTTTTTLNTNSNYGDEADYGTRGRSRHREGRHDNSRQQSASSYNSRDRYIDEQDMIATDNGGGVEATASSAFYRESSNDRNGGSISSAARSKMQMSSQQQATSQQQMSSQQMSSQQQVTSQQQISSQQMTSQQQQQQQQSYSGGTLDAKIKGKKSGSELDVSLLDLLMYLKTNDKILKSNTAGYIMHLTYNDNEAKRKIREFDIIPLLVKLLDHQDEDCHRNAAGALRNLSFGKFVNDNKLAIYECDGIEACVRLLYRTSWIEVREHVTGILCNLSSYESLKLEILRSAVEAVALLIIIPLSGWEKEFGKMDRQPGIISWSILLRNATGILRNVSSAGSEARCTIRAVEGLLDALSWILRAAVASDDREDINIKIVENVMCTLRNLSYKVDLEVDRNIFADAVRVPVKNSSNSPQSAPRDKESTNEKEDATDDSLDSSDDNNKKKKKNHSLLPKDASRTGCLGMKKKPFIKRIENRGTLPLQPNKKPPPEQWSYHPPNANDKKYTPMGVELLWQPQTVTIYISLITNSTNPLTLEAASAAIHNLCGCKWNWAALLRVHVRLHRGIPPLHDLLSVDQEFVVRSVAHALRNLAIDHTNKWSIGRFAHEGLIQVLPHVKSYETDVRPSEYTICAILAVLQALVFKDYTNSKKVKEADGINKLIALTREPPKDKKEERSLRTYSNKVIIEANRVLLYMWEFKDCREAIKKSMWSHGKAQEGERTFKNNTLKHQKKGDTIADVDSDDRELPMADRDERRYISLEQRTGDGEFDEAPPQVEYELKSFGHEDVPSDEVDESETLIRRSQKQKKNNNKQKGKSSHKNPRKSEEETKFMRDSYDEGELSAV